MHTENIMIRNISHIGKKLILTEDYHLLVTYKYNIFKMTSQVNMLPPWKINDLLGWKKNTEFTTDMRYFTLTMYRTPEVKQGSLVCRARPESKGQRSRTVGNST